MCNYPEPFLSQYCTYPPQLTYILLLLFVAIVGLFLFHEFVLYRCIVKTTPKRNVHFIHIWYLSLIWMSHFFAFLPICLTIRSLSHAMFVHTHRLMGKWSLFAYLALILVLWGFNIFDMDVALALFVMEYLYFCVALFQNYADTKKMATTILEGVFYFILIILYMNKVAYGTFVVFHLATIPEIVRLLVTGMVFEQEENHPTDKKIKVLFKQGILCFTGTYIFAMFFVTLILCIIYLYSWLTNNVEKPIVDYF